MPSPRPSPPTTLAFISLIPSPLSIQQGRDKFENEDLIKFSLPHDIWFHVDNLSSAHVYLRLPDGQGLDDIPDETLEDACQLVKANSIQGHKMNDLAIVYTPASNLKKTPSMEVGQVSFHDNKLVRKTKVAKKLNEIVNRLNKTKEERNPDLEAEKAAWEREQRDAAKAALKAMAAEEKKAKEEAKRMKEMMHYKTVLSDEVIEERAKEVKNKYTSAEEYEDDFF